VHGNASAHRTARNAARCLHAFGAPEDIRVYPGASKPLIRPTKHDPEIHGEDGLGGVEGFPDDDAPGSLARFEKEGGQNVRALDGMAKAIKKAIAEGHKVTVVSCGPCTNIALFVSVYPDLLVGIEQFVIMGGGVGLGNRSAVAGLAHLAFSDFLSLTCRTQNTTSCVTVGSSLVSGFCSSNARTSRSRTNIAQCTSQEDNGAHQRNSYRDCNIRRSSSITLS
jgi:hypothetical protein